MKRALRVLLLLAIGLGVYEPLEAKAERFSGRLPKFSAVAREDQQMTTEGGWHNVPGTWVQFTTTREGPAVATFCGALAVGGQDKDLRMRANGAGQWSPGEVLVDASRSSEGWVRTRCFAWFANLPAGTHKVRIQWTTALPSDAMVRWRSLKVEHQN